MNPETIGFPGASKRTQDAIAQARAQGYSIKATSDRGFLARQPQGRRDMKRIGWRLGTGAFGKNAYTIYAYCDVLYNPKPDILNVFALARALGYNVVNDHIVNDEDQ